MWRCFCNLFFVLAITGLTSPLLAAPPKSEILPRATKALVMTAEVQSVRVAWNATSIGKMLADPAPQPCLDDVQQRNGADAKGAVPPLGLWWEDAHALSAGKAALAIAPDTRQEAAFILIVETNNAATVNRVQQRLALGVNGPLDSTEPFTDVIQGTTYHGTSRTQGTIALNLLPNPSEIALQLACELTISSRSTGTKPRATVQSGSTTRVTGTKLVSFDGTGPHLTPAQVSVGTSSRIYGVQSSGFMERRRVNSGAEQSKGATEQQVARFSEQRLAQELDLRGSRLDHLVGEFVPSSLIGRATPLPDAYEATS